ncbi:MAG: nitroreductase family protein [Oscillospiraceae bacterium]|jgi:nitroreductase|nr:nitroreductase family protein [Oscillospiraceae bacterium]
MQFFDTMIARHSYRGEFEPNPIPREDLVKIVTAGIHAPSAGNQQSQRFYVVTDPALLAKIREIFQHPGVATAPALVLLVSKLLKFGENDSPFELQDYGAAAQNVLLAIADLGYSTVWTDGQTNFNKEFQEKIGSLLNLDEDATVRAVLPVGIPKTKGGQQLPRKPFDELVRFFE